MIHVLLRIAVWVVVLGIGYLVLGPQVFDSSPSQSPFESNSKIFLPPARSERETEYEAVRKERSLRPEEAADYQSLVRERESRFWQREGVSVEEALFGINTQRKARLAEIELNLIKAEIEAARAWYNSPEYQAILPIRLANSEGCFTIVDGYDG